MATASEVKLCPYCEEALAGPGLPSCPHCGRSLTRSKTRTAKFFECPDYLFFQKEALTKVPDKKPKEQTHDQARRLLLEIDSDLTKFVREADPETLTAALFDAHVILSHVLHADISGTTLKKIIITAKAIGKLGETIDQYIKAGGMINDDGKAREIGRLFSDDEGNSRSATATADGGRPR